MPVPVPRKPSAHPVFKQSHLPHQADYTKSSVFQQLTHTLPISPTGPPPSFGTREEWINSLPSWRKLKPRRIWEDDTSIAERRSGQFFQEGLIGAGNASVMKGPHAQACIPPLFTLQNSTLGLTSPATDTRRVCKEEADDEMNSDCSVMDFGYYENESQWSASSPLADEQMDTDNLSDLYVEQDRPGWHRDDRAVFEELPYERGAFSPIFEDDSPEMIRGPDIASSPIGPTTPFGEYVDRMVAAAQPFDSGDALYSAPGMLPHIDTYQIIKSIEEHCDQVVEKHAQSSTEPLSVPLNTGNYKKLSEPLAEWVVSYVWKVCTTGLSLPSEFALPMIGSPCAYSSEAPSCLVESVYSLFLSTLLQPSAIFLALWYIVRLPVFLGPTGLHTEHVKELRFRAELLGGADKELEDANAPFRLILLGCMLANKWLDDHTFSNKTWQTISNVPVESLNRLEALALDIFSHDLSTPPLAWSQWLMHLTNYHQSLSSPARPQPISRPSTNPHSIIRKTLEEIMQAPVGIDLVIPEPVFLGLEQRRREKLGLDDPSAEEVEVLEINLDEDGPLRDEYLPKRRVSRAGSVRSVLTKDVSDVNQYVDHARDIKAFDGKLLPPPAKWSPAADEPIFPDSRRNSGQYVAVQPPLISGHHVPLPAYQQEPRPQPWPIANYVPISQLIPIRYGYDPLACGQTLPAYTLYPYIAPMHMTHSRTHSLSCEHENSELRNYYRTYPQVSVHYRRNDNCMGANEFVVPPQRDMNWASHEQHGYSAHHRQPFGIYPNVNHQSTWPRT